jgi:hypothetical protein
MRIIVLYGVWGEGFELILKGLNDLYILTNSLIVTGEDCLIISGESCLIEWSSY